MNPDPMLATIWAFLIAFAVFAYVVMDGFDLGIGILFPTLKGTERDRAMNSIAPLWDGNETWLVLGGGGLFAAFPLAYAILMPALYPLIIAMLLGLVFRGVAFEFRWRDPAHRRWWDVGFTLGSLTAALAQGIALGAILQGIKVSGRAYAGGWLDWLSPFSLLTGLSLVAGYCLLGACWLIWRTEGEGQAHARRLAGRFGIVLLVAIALVSLATLTLSGDYVARWLAFPGVLLTAQVPLLVAILAVLFWRALARNAEVTPLLLALGMFLLSFLGLGISLFPNMIPPGVTILDAAAPAISQGFMLVGAVVLIPVILGYTGWAYWVFRGKVGEAGYH
ncbi:cytochrome d ubiquinol oxidase subunit II [Sphingomonas sp. CJ20]